jgi:hypothetical protein
MVRMDLRFSIVVVPTRVNDVVEQSPTAGLIQPVVVEHLPFLNVPIKSVQGRIVSHKEIHEVVEQSRELPDLDDVHVGRFAVVALAVDHAVRADEFFYAAVSKAPRAAEGLMEPDHRMGFSAGTLPNPRHAECECCQELSPEPNFTPGCEQIFTTFENERGWRLPDSLVSNG